MPVEIKDGAVVLFQGDSITDAGRGYGSDDELGMGYVTMVASMFSAIRPETHVRWVNRGISGNRVKDLRERWDRDCLEIKPDVVSIMIGVNDTWRRYDSDDATSAGDFEADYHEILRQVRDELNAELILLEPFVLPTPPDRIAWREDINPKIDAARRLAQKFSATLVPMDGIFARACAIRDPAFWAQDGVHPTPAGHALLAKSWLEAVGVM
ncbi:MAG: SGNH/GDSL hydrolase family protein [Phycisphaerae bacterium]|nr:SGNH/GDSL hydrolase family protein [Phycisphaerae bacterium]